VENPGGQEHLVSATLLFVRLTGRRLLCCAA
jgi:hypothetical protein